MKIDVGSKNLYMYIYELQHNSTKSTHMPSQWANWQSTQSKVWQASMSKQLSRMQSSLGFPQIVASLRWPVGLSSHQVRLWKFGVLADLTDLWTDILSPPKRKMSRLKQMLDMLLVIIRIMFKPITITGRGMKLKLHLTTEEKLDEINIRLEHSPSKSLKHFSPHNTTYYW